MALTCISPFNLLQTFNLIHDILKGHLMHQLAHTIPFWISHFTRFPRLYLCSVVTRPAHQTYQLNSSQMHKVISDFSNTCILYKCIYNHQIYFTSFTTRAQQHHTVIKEKILVMYICATLNK
jgi:hypothetical protein